MLYLRYCFKSNQISISFKHIGFEFALHKTSVDRATNLGTIGSIIDTYYRLYYYIYNVL